MRKSYLWILPSRVTNVSHCFSVVGRILWSSPPYRPLLLKMNISNLHLVSIRCRIWARQKGHLNITCRNRQIWLLINKALFPWFIFTCFLKLDFLKAIFFFSDARDLSYPPIFFFAFSVKSKPGGNLVFIVKTYWIFF